MSSTAATTEAPPAPQPAKHAQLRYAPLPNVQNAQMIHKRLFARATQRIAEYAARFGITEPRLVDPARLDYHFRAFASMLLIQFARDVLADAPPKWTPFQGARVRAPFSLYGLLEGERESRELDANLEDAPARLRHAILEGGDAGYEYLIPSHVERFLEDAVAFVKVGMPEGLRLGRNPPTVLTTLGSICSSIHLRQRPETVRELAAAGAPQPVRCSFTGREMQPDERVVRLRLVVDTTGGVADANAPPDVYENVVDYAPASERLRPGAGPLPPYLAAMRVSDLATNILNFTVSYHWVMGIYKEHIRQMCEYAAGNISSEVLEAQRQKNAAKHGGEAAAGAKNTVVLKVGSRDQVEQCFSAFELGTFTGHGLETMVELFVRFAKLQVHYLIACDCTRRLQHY